VFIIKDDDGTFLGLNVKSTEIGVSKYPREGEHECIVNEYG
jgi:hypothetical protein